ncbi:MAG: hypothetical protein DRJ05_03665 [Bacteroidetes bacterium]|nr:MAG: hypothetical protein DRJ05_03665 [Bacteroidota bacterium]
MIKPTLITALFFFLIGFVFPNQQTDSLSRAISSGTPIEKLDAMQELAKIKKGDNSWEEAQILYTEALAYIDSVPMQPEEAYLLKSEIMLDLAYIYLVYSAEYNRSLDLFIKVIKRGEHSHDTAILIKANRLLGFNYRYLKKYNKSLNYFNASFIYAKAYNDTIAMISAINEEANVYFYLDDFEKSKRLHLDALELAKGVNYSHGINFVSNDLALLYTELGKYNEALEYFLLVHNYGKQINNNRYICATAINIANVYLKLEKYDSVQFYYEIAEKIAINDNLRDTKLDVFRGLNDLYYVKGDYKNAYKYQEKHFGIRDTIFNLEKEKQIADISTKYEAGKKEKENKVLKQQNVIQELELEKGKSRFIFTILIAGIIVVFIISIALILYRSNLQKKRTNDELKNKNKQITLQKNQLIETLKFLSKREKELEEANITKDKFFSIIAHDIKNPFTSILGFSNMLRDDFDNLSLAEQKKYAGIISESSENLYKLLDNLLQWSRAQTNRIEFHPEKFDLSILLENNVALYKNAALKKKIEIIPDFKSGVNIFADKSMADVVIRNLLSNAIKFTKLNGRIKISAIENIDKVKIGIIDNGVGIEKSKIKKLFRIDSKVKSEGTDNEQGTGLGLIICKEFVERNGGKIWVESKKNMGSSFFFSLPKGL